MKQSVPETTYELDAEGHLVRLEGETDADYATRTAQVLHQSGADHANHPDDVEAQYGEPEPPPPEMNEGESQQDFQKRVHEEKEEWGKKNAQLREEALAKEKQAADERADARNKLREEQGIEAEAHATERSKKAEEDSRKRGPQPEDTFGTAGVMPVTPGPHMGQAPRK